VGKSQVYSHCNRRKTTRRGMQRTQRLPRSLALTPRPVGSVGPRRRLRLACAVLSQAPERAVTLQPQTLGHSAEAAPSSFGSDPTDPTLLQTAARPGTQSQEAEASATQTPHPNFLTGRSKERGESILGCMGCSKKRCIIAAL
jgi:hypothetical protein